MPDTPPFEKALREGVLVFDGAMGTEIYRHHVFTNRCFDELVLSDPKLISRIHEDYCEAGADVLTTDTFGANRVKLGQYGLSEHLEEICTAGARLAREVADAAPRPVWVAGSIGPLPAHLKYEKDVEGMILEQVDALVAGGVDFILFETQPTRKAIEKCALAMAARPDVRFGISFSVMADGESASGEPLRRLMATLPEGAARPFAWGMNCGTGPDGLMGALEQAAELTELPLIVQPNAGEAKEVGHRKIYLCSPEYLTEYAKRFVALGASAVGGCCGTNPDHIQHIALAIKPLARAASRSVVQEIEPDVELLESVPFAERSAWAARLAAGQWVTSVELVPPRGYDLSSVVDKSRELKERGVRAINIPDGPRASSRISPLLTCERILHQAGIEPILHFCCRDRNLIGMQADLLACAACEIHNILFVTGDPPKLGNYPQATGVFDTDAIGMTAVQERLNRGVDLGGQPIRPPTRAVIGVGLDPTALDQGTELDRFRQKVEAGAEFAVTQPVFDPEALLKFLDMVQHHGIPVVAGIWPLASLRNATFMQNEVPGVEIPDDLMQRMASVESREDQRKMGIEIARESVERVRDRVVGIQVSAPFGNIETAWAVIQS